RSNAGTFAFRGQDAPLCHDGEVALGILFPLLSGRSLQVKPGGSTGWNEGLLIPAARKPDRCSIVPCLIHRPAFSVLFRSGQQSTRFWARPASLVSLYFGFMS